MKDMAPIRFASRDGETLGVGDMVWGVQWDGVSYGCVTGFNFEDDMLDGVDLTIANDKENRVNARLFGIDKIFTSEAGAWLAYVEMLVEDYQTVKAGLKQKAGRIQDVIKAHSISLEFKP